MSDKRKNIERYHNVICDICNVKDIKRLNNAEMNGYLGVAIVMAYIDGINPEIPLLSKYLGVDRYHLNEPFMRLKINGVFSEKYNARNDDILKGKVKKNTDLVSSNHLSEIAWGVIAGTASGFVGIS